ncbi:MAG: hypothetical protein PHQ43_02400, partial [Dehalococcoidales bacterium]|nr:hypothetical protein [Dehalococcoidales bacterium]
DEGNNWDMVLVDVIKGVTAPNEDINAYTFPFYFANRAMLCGKIDTNELNRIDYSATNAPDVWNGEDSSFGPTGPLYFGEGGELTCAAAMYNRLGSNLYDLAVVCKHSETYMLTGFDQETWKIYTVSGSIGCPAPLTMATADIGLATGDEATRNIAMWLSYNGPVIFDGNSIIPIGQKIKPYFDKTDSRCVLHSIIEKSIGWVDNDYDEYNLLIPSGSSATSVNVWLCYDIKRNRWFRKQPNSLMGFGYPQAVVKVQDAYGTQYVYGFFDNGYMKRLEYGTTWAGAALTYAIQQSLTTAAQIPTGDIWDKTKVRRLKVVTDAATDETAMVVTHYHDGNSPGNSFTTIDSEETIEFSKNTQSVISTNPYWNCWSHKWNFAVNTSTQTNGIKLLMWGYQYVVTREDI